MIGPKDDVHTIEVETDERGQSLRLPAGLFRPGERVRVHREGERLILEPDVPAAPPVHPGWPAGFWDDLRALGPASAEFEQAVREARTESALVETPERERAIEDYVRWADEQHPDGARRSGDVGGPRPPGPGA